jgi:hypothetical protein
MKTYFCFLTYFATGEGLTYIMGMVIAENEESAKEKFIMTNFYADWDHTTKVDMIKQGLQHFSRGVEIFDFQDQSKREAIKDIMKDFLSDKMIGHLLDAEDAHALHKFNFHSYVNYS